MKYLEAESYNDYLEQVKQLSYLTCQLKSMFYMQTTEENIQRIFGVVIDDFSIKMQIALLKSIVEKDTMSEEEKELVKRFHQYRHVGLGD
ncbi:MAG: hypothetical protein KBD83_07535 [Gammaproteobacteria bacterium]|nr:hypothetical protein [Gammaproteobacteria bacterium]